MITISNTHDVPRVEFEKAYYVIQEPEVPSGVNTVHVKIVRRGDKSLSASVRCSTKDGSAEAGQDYQAKNQLLTFAPGQTAVDFPVSILHNSDKEWEEAFYAVLGPQDPNNAMLGEIAMATVVIVESSGKGSSILPAPPVIVPYDVYNGPNPNGIIPQPRPGEPVVCVSPCDPHYPTYENTGPLCEKMHIDQSGISYFWEVAPYSNNWLNYDKVCDDTPFTDSTSMVLDSVYFQPDCRIRCGATPRMGGHVGTPVTSKSVTVQRFGACLGHSMAHSHLPKPGGMPPLNGQSFRTNMEYLSPKAQAHPNTIHIIVKVPHQDGMIPLISTFPINNIKLLLTQPVYQQQHSCSNFAAQHDHPGFLAVAPERTHPGLSHAQSKPVISDLYNHLNLNTCTWTFDAFYPMTDLVDRCGGKVVASTMGPRGRVDVKVPLFVSYVFNQGPGRWTSVDHQTDLQVNMDYNPVQLSKDIGSLVEPTGQLQLQKLSTTDQGNLVINFQTTANFPGQFIGQAPNIEGIASKVTPPKDLPVAFVLTQVDQKNPKSGPCVQEWKAQSSQSVQDYSGMYYIDLVPCVSISPDRQPVVGDTSSRCQPQEPFRFEVPIVYQQTNRPMPLTYTLKTHFDVTNNPRKFRETRAERDNHYNVEFDRGQTVYGRVMWDPAQNLDSAYKLSIEKVFICTGPKRHDISFDSRSQQNFGVIQHGCLSPSPDIQHRTLILDREAPDVIVEDLGGHPLTAQLAGQGNALADVAAKPGEDAFAFSVDPLFEVGAGRQWYMQVLYGIHPSGRRFRRSPQDGVQASNNGTNMAKLVLHYNQIKSNTEVERQSIENRHSNTDSVKRVKITSAYAKMNSNSSLEKCMSYVVAIFCVILSLFIISAIAVSRYRQKNKKDFDE